MSLLFRDVEVAGRRLDVRVRGARIDALGEDLDPETFEVVEGHGGALIPGLHDHHVHLLATAAARTSVDSAHLQGLEAFAHALRGAPAADGDRDGWVRAIGYHSAVAGELDRHLLDLLVPDRPVRVQDRSGDLWVLNSRALGLVADVLPEGPDVERDRFTGEPTGRLRRLDTRLRSALPDLPPDLGALSHELASYGITSVTDATPDLDAATVALLRHAHLNGDLPQHATLLGDPDSAAPWRLLLREQDLPSPEELGEQIQRAHRRQRPVAVHCMTRESLLLTLTALDEVGRRHGDRIEQATIVPFPAALRGLRVVTQPGLILERGDDYLREIQPHDLPHLYPLARLIEAGIETVASSDSPYGPLNPWTIVRAARDRRTAQGRLLGPEERIPAAAALGGYLTAADGAPRQVAVGEPADLCLLHTPLAEALATDEGNPVRATYLAGQKVPA